MKNDINSAATKLPQGRKAVQISVAGEGLRGIVLTALCDDNTIWTLPISVSGGYREVSWEKMPSLGDCE